MFSPLEQFTVFILGEFRWNIEWSNIIVTNFAGVLVICCFICLWYSLLYQKFSLLLQNVRNFLVEKIFMILLNMITQVNTVVALRFYPVLVSVAIFVLSLNLIGLMPYGFTITSQLIVTFTMSISLFIGVMIIGGELNKFSFLKFFVPSAVSNDLLKYFLIIIEVLSFVIRPFSLGIRLFANMLAGHTLLFILGGFMFTVINKNIILIFLMPLSVVVMVILLEICIAFIQAYVFTILLIIYINDMFNISH